MTVNCEAYPVPPPLKKLDQPKLKINILSKFGNDSTVSMGAKKEQPSSGGLFISSHLLNKDKPFDSSVYMS